MTTKLGEKLYCLISQAVKINGTFEPEINLPHFEEYLTVHEYDLVYAFLEWCHKNDKTFGYGNYEQIFQEFLKSKQTITV